MDRLIHRLPWTKVGEEVTEELRFSENEYKDKKYFAVRIWFRGREKDKDQFFPGKQGINVPVEKLDEFYHALGHAYDLLVSPLPVGSKKKVGKK